MDDNETPAYTLAGGLRVQDFSVDAAVRACRTLVDAGRTVHVCTLNPELAELALADPSYKDVLDAAHLTTIDGVGISLAVLRQHGRFPGRVTGVSILHALARDAAAHGREVIIIGASDASRREAEARLRARGITVREGISPMVNADGTGHPLPVEMIPPGGLVVAAMGSPKQEFWIRRQLERGGPPAVYVGVGGAVDYVSGATPTPPKILRRLGMQWLYRLVTEPGTRMERQRRTLPRFVWRQVVRGR
ncbi:WecB/TagA/CpsF family glycosyltransferase [Longimicrobium terrae]|uniref:N-acetylglucosaminyldiphosphoundecaprenol N-acetyl-beta-D-mannosaminyltransferase n=1 Tax=Longimicrobium terrae TaxID=1639882 RepID=A0A841GUE2_9BACT|nr:WecB/TagA/CpsF family glycosyltransferase [Longimicrobium terrae]MBB4634537.1 N-acetylglucosaminyldiphosphoundecaprenol N-acetyl-beta-D-mannosaminyltransferase [Longimicrobium terrae]MBB6068573.1 N-acetylglucosaminyldiphosphoundecaprenol N-acetyl-beta-D-mannosaminyltransferase [Longimicrobium terrae]NNC27760.1 WecB/TagA/CpsF family glycosyltransferase [Longimicrobium terrae]